jgi:Mn2+/Fe2+ NRAMP family transporter
LFKTGVRIEGAKDAALALGPLAGENATILFALGLLNASLFSAAILPLSTAYTVCEAFGWESSISHDWKDAPMFFGIYTALIVLGAAIILLPIKSLIDAMMISQTFNGVLLPVILITMLQLINDKRIMGKYVNGKIFNILAWITVIILIILAAILVVTTFFPGIIQG